MVVTHTHGKDQGQRSVGLKDRVETDDCIITHPQRANAVGNNSALSTVLNHWF